MGNGQTAEKRDKECYLCGSDVSKASYFMRIIKNSPSWVAELLEVCPECHHFYTYGTEEQLENYKKRRNIKI